MISIMENPSIYIIRISLVKDNLSFISSFADEKRREKALKFVNEKDQLLCFGAGYLLKKYLPNEEILENSNGKPYLPNGPFFNISHSGEYVVLVVHPSRDVGVDIERIDDKKLDAIKYVLNEVESSITETEKLFQIWSNKESLVKCMSLRLMDIRRVSALPLDGVRTINGEDYYTKSMIYEGHSLSITLKGNEPFKVNINLITSVEESL